MASSIVTLCMLMCLTLLPIILVVAQNDNANNYIDVEPPTFFNYNSPLRQPESLRSRPYFDFLSTLYRRDADKSNLFRPYSRTRRDIDSAHLLAPLPEVAAAEARHVQHTNAPRPRRALVFRPLFVYRQQQVRRQEIAARKRRV